MDSDLAAIVMQLLRDEPTCALILRSYCQGFAVSKPRAPEPRPSEGAVLQQCACHHVQKIILQEPSKCSSLTWTYRPAIKHALGCRLNRRLIIAPTLMHSSANR